MLRSQISNSLLSKFPTPPPSTLSEQTTHAGHAVQRRMCVPRAFGISTTQSQQMCGGGDLISNTHRPSAVLTCHVHRFAHDTHTIDCPPALSWPQRLSPEQGLSSAGSRALSANIKAAPTHTISRTEITLIHSHIHIHVPKTRTWSRSRPETAADRLHVCVVWLERK